MGRVLQKAGRRRGDQNGTAGAAGTSGPNRSNGEPRTFRSDGGAGTRSHVKPSSSGDRARIARVRCSRSPIALDLDGAESLILVCGPVGGSSSGRTSVSGSDYLGSIPSPPAKMFSSPFPIYDSLPYRAGGSSSGRTPAFGAGYLGSIPSPPAITSTLHRS